MKILKVIGIGLGGLIALVVLCIGLLFIGARFADGPMGMIPGGPLASGDWVEAPIADWRFATDIDTIELQLADADRSRTVWILEHDGKAYVPCSLSFPPGKTWYTDADKDGRAVLRIDGKRYAVQLSRIDDTPIENALKATVGRKYGGGPPSDAGVWFFEVTSRQG